MFTMFRWEWILLFISYLSTLLFQQFGIMLFIMTSRIKLTWCTTDVYAPGISLIPQLSPYDVIPTTFNWLSCTQTIADPLSPWKLWNRIQHEITIVKQHWMRLLTAQASTRGREPMAQNSPEFGSGALYDPSLSVHMSFGIIVTGANRKSNVGLPFNVSDPYPYI